jgi:hypothetical protein
MNAVRSILNLEREWNQYTIECWSTTFSKFAFDYLLQKSDIIITQHIKDHYREKDYLSTSYVISNCKKECKIIMIDVCYFNFYYTDLTYKSLCGELLKAPSYYHHQEIIDHYKSGKSLNDFINNVVNNENYKSTEKLNRIAMESLYELITRHKLMREKHCDIRISFISIFEYIYQNYKKKLLFYSMNHPSKDLLQFICEKIKNILNLKLELKYDLDPYANHIPIIYNCVQKAVFFDIKDYIPKLNAKDGVYDVASQYYYAYDEISLKSIDSL